MRKILGAILALFCVSAFGTTYVPVQLLNPAGSTSGQAILSTGSSSVPVWGNVSATALTGLVPIANGGTNAATAAAALTNLGAAPTASPTFTGTVTIPGGSITGTTISGSTGSFTTLAASSSVTGTGFNNLFASPPNIGAVAAATGKFTTLQATSAFTPSSTAGIVGTVTNDSANAGSVGEYVTASTASTAVTSSVTANAASISLAAGDWEVEGLVQTIPAGTTVVTGRTVGISTTSATVATAATGVSNASISWYSAPAGFVETIIAPRTRIKLASTTTVYLIANIGFNTSTCAVAGFIRATRPR
jgi:hypothetical protein